MDWYSLSKIAPISYVHGNPDKPWDRYGLSRNRDMTMDILIWLDREGTHLTGGWDWMELSKVIPIPDVRKHLDRPWNRRYLSRMGITVDDLLYLDSPSMIGDWDWFWLSRYLPIRDIVKYPHLPWHREYLSRNEGITPNIPEYMDKYLDPPDDMNDWDWHDMGMVMPMTTIVGYIREGTYPKIVWHRYAMSHNPSLTMDHIKEIDRIVGNMVEGNWQWSRIAKLVPMATIMAYTVSQL